ncbi:hypothetical protein D3C87_1277400 [compost metagenome]
MRHGGQAIAGTCPFGALVEDRHLAFKVITQRYVRGHFDEGGDIHLIAEVQGVRPGIEQPCRNRTCPSLSGRGVRLPTTACATFFPIRRCLRRRLLDGLPAAWQRLRRHRGRGAPSTCLATAPGGLLRPRSRVGQAATQDFKRQGIEAPPVISTILASVDAARDFVKLVRIGQGVEPIAFPEQARNLETHHGIGCLFRLTDQIQSQQFPIARIVGAPGNLDRPATFEAMPVARMRVAKFARQIAWRLVTLLRCRRPPELLQELQFP